MTSNAFIADRLEEEASTRNDYGGIALMNSASIIRTFKAVITDARQLKGVRGIGEGTRKRVQAILELGEAYQVPIPSPAVASPAKALDVPASSVAVASVSSAPVRSTSEPVSAPPPSEKPNKKRARLEAESEQKEPILFDFTCIKFIGAVCNRNLHEKGIHTLDELERRVANNTVSLQANQRAGLKYRLDLAQRVPREEVKEIGELVLAVVKKYDMRGDIVGSYRRGRADSGDIDVLITGDKNKIHRIVAELKTTIIKYIFSFGEVKLMAVAMGPSSGVCRSLDIRFVPEAIYASSLLFATGPMELNIYQRQLAIEKGMKLSEYGLVDGEGKLMAVGSEEAIFEVLGMEWLTPIEREAFNAEKVRVADEKVEEDVKNGEA